MVQLVVHPDEIAPGEVVGPKTLHPDTVILPYRAGRAGVANLQYGVGSRQLMVHG